MVGLGLSTLQLQYLLLQYDCIKWTKKLAGNTFPCTPSPNAPISGGLSIIPQPFFPQAFLTPLETILGLRQERACLSEIVKGHQEKITCLLGISQIRIPTESPFG